MFNSNRRVRNAAGATIAITGLAAAALFGTNSFAGDIEGSDDPPAEPGTPFVVDSGALIQTDGDVFDETVVTKFIAAGGFDTLQGAGGNADLVNINNKSCYQAQPSAAGLETNLYAPVELPDGARIKRVAFFGQDTSDDHDITIRLFRSEFSVDGATPANVAQGFKAIDFFRTEGNTPGGVALAGRDDLRELAGSVASDTPGETLHRFHTLSATITNTAGENHVICGAEIEYQVAVPEAEAGTIFHAIDPIRAFDSRVDSFSASGRLGPNSTKRISVANGHDEKGAEIRSQVGLIPANATAVTYNITVAQPEGSNFIAVTPAGLSGYNASSINFTEDSGNIANAGTVSVNDTLEITLWGGDQGGSAHVLVDITGYYAPATGALPNFGG